MATLILKATERCNSNCYYCDVVWKNGGGQTMEDATLEMVFRRADEYLRHYPEEKLEILWHGGEPLLVGTETFRRALELQRQHCSQTEGRIHHSIQTNLTCMTDELAVALKALGMSSVGTSYDPEPHMRGPGRGRDSGLYNRRFMEGLRVLQRHRMGWGMIYVVTKRSLRDPLGVFYFLTNLLLTGGINLNPVLIYDEERTGVAVSPKEYAEFLAAIFPLWWRSRSRFPSVQPFDSITRNVLDGDRSDLGLGFGICSALSDRIEISPLGRYDRLDFDDPRQKRSYGNLARGTLSDALTRLAGDVRREEVQTARLCAESGCGLLSLCRLDPKKGGGARGFIRKDQWCLARQGFVYDIFAPTTGAPYPSPATRRDAPSGSARARAG